MMTAAVLLLTLAAAGAASAQQAAPTAPPQSVVVPSLPDEKNKEGTVRPSSSLATGEGGWVKNNPAAVDPKAGAAAGGGSGRDTPRPAVPGAPIPAPPAPGPGPAGPAEVGAAQLSIRGVVKAYEKGVSITVEANGKKRTLRLAEKVVVFDGLKVGDKVVVRVPLKKPADGKTADRVEKQKPPKAAPKSSFSAAQTPGT